MNAYLVGNFHDEQDWQVDVSQIDFFKKCLTKAIEKTNIKFKLKVPMDIDIKIGNNWEEIH